MRERRILRDVLYHLFVIAFGLLMIYPVIWMILSSFKLKSEILGAEAPFWPTKWICWPARQSSCGAVLPYC